ncbi:hypothetical protein Tco_0584146 [Tanacetum coccineum]
MCYPQRASPPPSQSSPIPAFNLDDENLKPLWASASQPSQYTECPSEPVEDDSPVEEVEPVTSETTSQGNSDSAHIGLDLNEEAADSEDVDVQEVAPKGRDRAKKKASSSGAR